MTKRIIGMGNAVLDILTKVENNFIDENNLSKGTMAIVSKDESQKILEKIEMIKTDSGGSVANTISTISLLGLESSFCGKVMNDKLGNDFENKMTESGTNFLCDKSNSGLPTARCVVFVTPDGERTMQTFLGASTTLSAADIREEYFKEQDFLLIEGYLWSSETAREAITKAVNFCKQFNVKIIFSLSDPNLVKSLKHDFLRFINEDVDILIGNEDEFESLLDSNIQKTKITENLNLDIAVITKGSDGADFIKQNELTNVMGTKVDSVIDTTGAGDMFAAGFIFKYINGYDPKESVEFANKLASLIIQKFGARADSEMLNKII